MSAVCRGVLLTWLELECAIIEIGHVWFLSCLTDYVLIMVMSLSFGHRFHLVSKCSTHNLAVLASLLATGMAALIQIYLLQSI
jgi:hypothetical protein